MEIGKEIGRPRGTRQRWEFSLKPWLLQHFSGTLNLDIRRMLANYLADRFEDVDSVNWDAVAKKPKFAGHSRASLRNEFSYLLKSTKDRMKVTTKEVTLQNVADYSNEAYGPKRARNPIDRVLNRQKAVIDFFETYIKKHNYDKFKVSN